MKLKLSKEEREMVRSVEAGEWRSVSGLSKEKKRYQAYAKAAMKKIKRVNIRLSELDLFSIQRKAMQEGIPYQTLMASVLHKYATGQFSQAAH